MKTYVLPVVLIGTLCSSAQAQLENLVGQPLPQFYVAPGQMFRVSAPNGWTPVPISSDPNLVEFRANGATVRVILTVRRIKVPTGASSLQLALNIKETTLATLPLWSELGTKKAIVGGRPAVVVTGTYAYQGNVQYPIALEETYIVCAEEAFILHFECFSGAVGDFAALLDAFYKSFIPRPTPDQLRPPPQRGVTDLPY